MNKLMIAIAAVAMCGAVVAEENSIASANIVGYASKTTPSSVYTMYGPAFSAVGDTNDGVQLKDIQYPATETGDMILLISPTTAAYTELTYFTDDVAKEEIAEDAIAGWYDCTGDAPVYKGDEFIPRGYAFWINPGNGDVNVTDSGEVRTTFSRTFPSGLYSAFANPFPVKMALKNFNYPATDTGDALLLIDPETAAYTELTYFTEDVAKEEIAEDAIAGWYDVTGDEPIYMGEYKFKPSEGAWLLPGNGDITVTASLEL